MHTIWWKGGHIQPAWHPQTIIGIFVRKKNRAKLRLNLQACPHLFLSPLPTGPLYSVSSEENLLLVNIAKISGRHGVQSPSLFYQFRVKIVSHLCRGWWAAFTTAFIITDISKKENSLLIVLLIKTPSDIGFNPFVLYRMCSEIFSADILI